MIRGVATEWKLGVWRSGCE